MAQYYADSELGVHLMLTQIYSHSSSVHPPHVQLSVVAASYSMVVVLELRIPRLLPFMLYSVQLLLLLLLSLPYSLLHILWSHCPSWPCDSWPPHGPLTHTRG